MILQSVTDLKQTPARIISLVPSQTELLHFLGLEEETIAITKFCVHPAKWKSSKKIIGGTKNVDLDKVKKLQPDLIIANKEENVKEQVEELAKEHHVWLTDVNSLETALQMILDVGHLTNASDKAAKLVHQIANDFSTLPEKSLLIPSAYLIWRNPFITVGGDTFINDMLSQCGLQNLFADKIRYPVITIKELKDSGCRVLLLSSEPYPFKQRHIAELQSQLPETRIFLADGEIFSWYGNRLLKAPGYFRKLMSKINEELTLR